MICFKLSFPLGVYHGVLPGGRGAEWVPSPVRLIGALLAAAHEVPSSDTDADRTVLAQLCAAPPPTIYAPRSVPCSEMGSNAQQAVVAELRGASRWAPRNPTSSELKGLSVRDFGGPRAEVDKSGVAIGEIPIFVAWSDLEVTNEDLCRLQRLASDTAWLGTSRTPVTIDVSDSLPHEGPALPRWSPLPFESELSDAEVRVPTANLISQFDAAFTRRTSAKGRVEGSGHQAPATTGWPAPYSIDDILDERVVDPAHWGRFTIVAIDDASDVTPKVAATYLVARAFRAALLDAFAEHGSPDDAPAILHGHGDAPHMAIVPLPVVGGRHASGALRGFGLIFPHQSRCADVDDATRNVGTALQQFFPGAEMRRAIRIPGMGAIRIRPLDSRKDRLWTLSSARYTGPAKAWTTVTPVVHSRWQKGRDQSALERQVVADCGHVGLPEPTRIEVLRSPGALGGAGRLLPTNRLPLEWRRSIQGPTSHLRIEFPTPVQGPVLLGRARHFGVGLCIPTGGSE